MRKFYTQNQSKKQANPYINVSKIREASFYKHFISDQIVSTLLEISQLLFLEKLLNTKTSDGHYLSPRQILGAFVSFHGSETIF